MDQKWVREYVEQYLQLFQCHIIEREPSHTTAKLSVPVDKDLTNRPYYWTFVERMGVEPETMTMTFIFDPEHSSQGIRGEEIRFGSNRLQQIFHSTKKRGKMVRLYQQQLDSIKTFNTLSPWLGVNYKIEFISDKKKDKLVSVGINLSNGKMKENFIQTLQKINLSPMLPANVSTVPTFITFREAALQLEEWILHEIKKENFKWAEAAQQRLEEEIEQIESYYLIHEDPEKEFNPEQQEEKSQKLVEKERRLNEVKWQYSPRIEVKPINYGVFYLSEQVPENVEYIH
ncbi:YqhG family protein [Tepidibacillus sp. HK-1]|uniref:YqhG family protein n=1 Tax=Tepidibacillus sp. HK-1 TaxID=1883407 RepID=UPI000853C7E2|nr:YqhG family protein [Tepidibacillus sp. HK-1]GBF10998.1 bacterial protein YqhG of unknown function [Tepidibacillus sp. HK-1]